MSLPFPANQISHFLQRVGRMQLRARDRGAVKVVADLPSGPVTNVDVRSQNLLREWLAALAPEVRFIGEESDGLPRILVPDIADDAYLWILDPLDGTRSFLEGSPTFGIQLALLRGRQLVGGWIQCPALQQSACAWTGAPLQREGTWPASRQPPSSLGEVRAVLADGDFNSAHLNLLETTRLALKSWRGTRSCAVDYLELLAGKMDVLLYRQSLPWDHAAGIYLATRGGALTRRFDGMPYQVDDSKGGLIVLRHPALAAHNGLFLLVEEAGHRGLDTPLTATTL